MDFAPPSNASLPAPGTLVVPDDELFRRTHGSTVETLQKYRMILAASGRSDVRLVGLTALAGEPPGVPEGDLFFFAGLPCLGATPDHDSVGQCAAVLQRYRAVAIDEWTVRGPSFFRCAITADSNQPECLRSPGSLRLFRIEGASPAGVNASPK